MKRSHCSVSQGLQVRALLRATFTVVGTGPPKPGTGEAAVAFSESTLALKGPMESPSQVGWTGEATVTHCSPVGLESRGAGRESMPENSVRGVLFPCAPQVSQRTPCRATGTGSMNSFTGTSPRGQD